MDLNRVVLMGNVGGEPELRAMNSGEQMARFGLATSRKWKVGEDWKQDTTWHQIVVFNKWAVQTVAELVQKGTRLYLEGEVKTRSYEKEGIVKYVTEIIVPNFSGKLIIIKGGRGEEDQYRSTTTSAPASNAGQQSSTPDYDDDIPF